MAHSALIFLNSLLHKWSLTTAVDNSDQDIKTTHAPEAPFSLGVTTVLLASVTQTGLPTVAPFVGGLHSSVLCSPHHSLLAYIWPCSTLCSASWPLYACEAETTTPRVGTPKAQNMAIWISAAQS